MDVPDDVTVAAAAAVSTVVTALAAAVAVPGDVSVFVEIAPLYVYFAYLFTRRASLPDRFDTVRIWAGLSALAAVGAIAYAAV
jgi:hypothetical protein